MAKRGRPPKYDEVTHKAIIDSLTLGCSRTTAAELAGIDRGTLADWIEKYPAFNRDVKRAIASCKRTASTTIRQAILHKGDVNAAFRYLAYQEPDEWTEPPTKHEVTGADGGPLTIRVIYADYRSDAS